MASFRLLTCKRVAQIVSQLVPKNSINCCKQNLSSKSIYYQKTNKLLKNNSNDFIKFNQKCLFQTSQKRYNPLVAILLRNVAKFAAVITGRFDFFKPIFKCLQ